MAPSPTGRQFVLERGRQRAVVVEIGGGIRTYEVAGRQIIDGYSDNESPPGAAGQLLAPWPNRIEDGRYTFDGVDHPLAISEPGRNNALHGLCRTLAWKLESQIADSAELSCRLQPSQGYPFELQLSVRWSLTDGGLRADHRAENIGSQRCPFGFGAHPYLFGNLDDQVLTVPAQRRLVANARGIPTKGVQVNGTPWDFRKGRSLKGMVLDDAFEALHPDADGLTRICLEDSRGQRSTLWMDASFPVVQLYSGETLSEDRRRRSLAVEPMTCAANAFRTGQHLIVLNPRDIWLGSWGIEAKR